MHRNKQKKQWLRNIQSFQFIQADQKREEAKTARDTENKERRAHVKELHDTAQAKGYQDCLNEKAQRDLNGQILQEFIKRREQQRQYMQELDDDLLQIADNQTEREHKQTMKEKIERYMYE